MRIFLLTLTMTAAAACFADSDISPTQSQQARTIEAMSHFDITARSGTQHVATQINGCMISIDTTATSGERAGQLDHRDTFRLGTVAFTHTGTTPPIYVSSIIPGVTLEDDPSVPIQVAYEGLEADAILRSVPLWKNPREPFAVGPVLDGVQHALAPRQRGSFILDTPDQLQAANDFVTSLVAYGAQYCGSGLS